MKAKLIEARNLSELIADMRFVIPFRFSDFSLQSGHDPFMNKLKLLRVGREESLKAKAELENLLDGFDRIFETWEGLMDRSMTDALELSGIEPFNNRNTIAFDFIQKLRSEITGAIVSCYSEEHCRRSEETMTSRYTVGGLWRNSEKRDGKTAGRIFDHLELFPSEDDKSHRRRMRLEYNAAICSLAPLPIQQKKKPTISEIMAKIASRRPEALGWKLARWVEETGHKKSSISSCVYYKSDLLRKARKEAAPTPRILEGKYEQHKKKDGRREKKRE